MIGFLPERVRWLSLETAVERIEEMLEE